jgi:hypothetical protein
LLAAARPIQRRAYRQHGEPAMPDETLTNGYDSDELKSYLDSIDAEDEKLLSLQSDYMNLCKGPRGRIRETIATAKEAGVNMVAFRMVLEKHRMAKRHQRHVEELEADDGNSYQKMLDALGVFADTPLGVAALDKAAKGDQVLDQLSSH